MRRSRALLLVLALGLGVAGIALAWLLGTPAGLDAHLALACEGGDDAACCARASTTGPLDAALEVRLTEACVASSGDAETFDGCACGVLLARARESAGDEALYATLHEARCARGAEGCEPHASSFLLRSLGAGPGLGVLSPSLPRYRLGVVPLWPSLASSDVQRFVDENVRSREGDRLEVTPAFRAWMIDVLSAQMSVALLEGGETPSVELGGPLADALALPAGARIVRVGEVELTSAVALASAHDGLRADDTIGLDIAATGVERHVVVALAP